MTLAEVVRGLGPKYTSLRPAQEEILGALLENDSRLKMVEAPTGVGKSALAIAYARMKEVPFTVVSTATLSLQNQYDTDFPAVCSLMGKGNFRCSLDERLSPAEAPCVFTGETCNSAYYEQEERYAASHEVVTNYALYLSELMNGRRWYERHPDLLVCDEGHRLLDFLSEIEGVTFSTPLAQAFGYNPPRFKTLAQAKGWAKEVRKEVTKRTQGYVLSRNPRSRDAMRLMRQVEALAEAPESLVVVSVGDTFRAVPVWPTASAQALMKSAREVLVMSATLWGGTFFQQLLGYHGQAAYLSVPSQFPSNNWPVYYKPVARMNNKSTTQDWQNMAEACHTIMHQHSEEKGVIHVASFKQADKIAQRLKGCAGCRKRLVANRLGERRADTIGRYRESPRTWIVHPSIGEGESFDDDQCRVQVIAKLKYPDLSSPVVKMRTQSGILGKNYYFHSTAAYTAQTVGRGMRHPDDYCENYILDGSFASLYDKNRKAFPIWFQNQLR